MNETEGYQAIPIITTTLAVTLSVYFIQSYNSSNPITNLGNLFLVMGVWLIWIISIPISVMWYGVHLHKERTKAIAQSGQVIVTQPPQQIIREREVLVRYCGHCGKQALGVELKFCTHCGGALH